MKLLTRYLTNSDFFWLFRVSKYLSAALGTATLQISYFFYFSEALMQIFAIDCNDLYFSVFSDFSDFQNISSYYWPFSSSKIFACNRRNFNFHSFTGISRRCLYRGLSYKSTIYVLNLKRNTTENSKILLNNNNFLVKVNKI